MAPVKKPALWTAASEGKAEEVRRLLEEGADVEGLGGVTKCTALHVASGRGHEEVVLLLLEHGAQVSAKDSDGAASQGREEVVRRMLEKLRGLRMQLQSSQGQGEDVEMGNVVTGLLKAGKLHGAPSHPPPAHHLSFRCSPPTGDAPHPSKG